MLPTSPPAARRRHRLRLAERPARRVALALGLGAGLAAGLAGCGKDGEELLGMWQVTAHTENPAGCEAEGPAVTDPPFIRFAEGSFFGQDYFEYVACRDAAGADCDPSAGLFTLLYAEPVAGGMRAAIYAASGSSDDCLLAATISDAVVTAGALRIETRRRHQDGVTDSACDADDAEARAATLPCTELEVLVGQRP